MQILPHKSLWGAVLKSLTNGGKRHINPPIPPPFPEERNHPLRCVSLFPLHHKFTSTTSVRQAERAALEQQRLIMPLHGLLVGVSQFEVWSQQIQQEEKEEELGTGSNLEDSLPKQTHPIPCVISRGPLFGSVYLLWIRLGVNPSSQLLCCSLRCKTDNSTTPEDVGGSWKCDLYRSSASIG